MIVAYPADSDQPPLTPRNGHTLKVLGIARISTEHQDALSLDDQEALYRQWLAQHTGLPFALTMIAGRGSGECLDRQEALQASAEVQTGTYDLVIAEDLGRIFRRIHAQLFCELCEDVGTRLVAINHHVDTERDDWRMHAFFATMRHEMYNADTAKRIRRTMHAVLTEVLTNADLLATLRPILPTAPPESTTDTPTLPKGVFRRACDGLKAATGTACAAAAVAALLRARQPDLLAFEADPTASFLALS